MTSTAEGLELICPRCRAELGEAPEAFLCSRCGTTYPIVAGIPDFRIAPDPWIEPAADRAKGLRLERETAELGLEAVVRAYWAMTPETPHSQAERFIAHVMGAEQRSREWLDTLAGEQPHRPPARWLDIGCGTADLAAAAWPRAEVVGIDVAFRWLVVARRRLADRGLPIRLVCCNAEALPFPDHAFAGALSLGALEHCLDLGPVLHEARRVLAPGSSLHLRTVNRYSALPEPHTGVWGVGWVPRRLADSYVHLLTGTHYLHHRLLSPAELRRAMQEAGFLDIRVEAARLLPAEAERLSPALRWAGPAYRRVRTMPLAGSLVRLLAPLLEAHGTVP